MALVEVPCCCAGGITGGYNLPCSMGQPRSPGELGFPDLVSGLKSTPGCLGVETATTAGGSRTRLIFEPAGFENEEMPVSPKMEYLRDSATRRVS